MDQDAWIHRTAAGAHHQAFQGTEAHSRGQGDATSDSSGGATAAQMAGDQPQLGRVAPEDFSRAARAIGVADAVETNPADAPVAIPFVGQRIDAGFGRQIGVEGGVENGDLGHARQGGFGGFNRLEGRRVVQGGQLVQTGNGGFYLAVNQDAFPECGPAVDYPVSHHADHWGALVPGGA